MDREDKHEDTETLQRSKRIYKKPQLVEYGSVAKLTRTGAGTFSEPVAFGKMKNA